MPVVVDCPTCGRRVEWKPENRWRPFCSERCKLVDLGAWATEKYTLPGEAPREGDPEAGTPPAGTGPRAGS